MIRVPFGLIFQASCAVSAGIGAIGCGYIDMGSLLGLGFTRLLLSYNYFSHSPAESAGGARHEVLAPDMHVFYGLGNSQASTKPGACQQGTWIVTKGTNREKPSAPNNMWCTRLLSK